MARNRHGLLIGAMVFSAACGGSGGDASGVDISGTLTITNSSGDEEATATVDGQAAFGVSVGELAMVYVSSSPDATCGDLAGYLDSVGEAFDPSALFVEDRCNLLMLVADGYSADGIEFVDDPFGATWAISCTLGDGEFVYEERDTNDWDYYWSNRHWQGNAQDWTATLSGGDGDDFSFETTLNELNGNFPYENFTAYPASSDVTGSAVVEWCGDLSSAALVEAYL